jgi:uncharacterized protein with PQ loop repeat
VSLVDLVGWFAALCSATLAVPQLVRIVGTRTVAGLSQVTWQMNTAAGIGWTGHGLLVGKAQLIWPNVLLGLTSSLVLWQIVAALRLPLARTWLPAIALGMTSVAADVVLGPLAFAVLAFIPGALGQLTQLRDTRRATDTSGVSMGFLAMSLLTQLSWLTFAIPSGELAVLCVAAPMAVLAASNVIALWQRRRVVAGQPEPVPA